MTEPTDAAAADQRPLDAARQASALALLDELLDDDTATRDARVETLRASDPDLADLVTRLLGADAAPDHRLEHRVTDDDEAGAEPDSLIGSRLGVWRIVGRIGQGGMGVVYRAERADGQFEQTCALKLVAVGLNHASARQRFLRERQILARLQHDNIALLIDGGVTERNEPWFAMELVDGIPLNQWCDERRLGLRDRIVLFQQVLDAVRYAHSRLVVHRDLKPSNILVTPDGRVKLLDFGVAKLLEESPAAAGQTIDLALTPQYAAPEQLVGDNIGPAADIYTLGVLLYAQLSGASPFGRDVGGQAFLRQRLARMDAPVEPLPQAAARQPPDIAQARRMRPQALRRALRGGLTAIVHRCLAPDPAHRYISVDGLTDDLNRWLESRPVLAYKGRWRYRAGQFVKRHRLALTFVVLMSAGVIAFTVDRGIQLAQTRYERDLYTRTFNFVTDVMARASAGRAGHDMTVREALGLMQSEMDRRDLPPEARSWLTSFIADAHVNANDPQSAVAATRHGIETSAKDGGLVQARLLEGQAMAQEMAGKHAAAIDSLGEALAIVERQRASEPQVATLSRLLTTKVRYGIRQRLLPLDEAQRLAERAIALGDASRSGPRTTTEDQAQAYIALVDVHLLARRYDDARATLAQVEALLRAKGLLGNDMLLDAYLAAQHLVLGDNDLALAAFETLIAAWTQKYGPDFRTVASLQAQYAVALERAGRVAASLRASEDARRIARRDDTSSMDVLDLDRLIARRLLRTGDHARAAVFARNLGEALAQRDEPHARSVLAQTWLLRAEAALLAGDAPSSVAALFDNARSTLDGLDATDLRVIRARRMVDRLEAERSLLAGDNAGAERHARAALESVVDVLDDPHEVLLAHRALGLALLRQPGKADAGRRELDEARRLATSLFDDCNPFVLAMDQLDPVMGSQALAVTPLAHCIRGD